MKLYLPLFKPLKPFRRSDLNSAIVKSISMKMIGKIYCHVTKNTCDMAIYLHHVVGIGKRYWYVTTLSYGFIPLREGRSLLGLALAH